MRRTNKILITILLISIMLLGLGYAAIQNITLNITGTAIANPSQSNFTVRFSENVQVSDSSKVIAAITDDTNATINVSGLTTSGDTVTATYTVQNTSKDLSANLSVETTNSNEEYFLIESKLGNETLTAGGATTLTVTVQLTKTPISTTETSTIGIQLTAEPVQPGEEDKDLVVPPENDETSDLIETTLATVTNDNIGDYIDLGNNIVGTESTADDWRILYEENGKVYAILADYLPNSTNYAKNAGLIVGYGTDCVYSNTNGDDLLNRLTTSANWNGLANGIAGAIVTGAPTKELVLKSYDAVNKSDFSSTTGHFTLSSTTENYDLYVPHEESINGCNGWWFANKNTGALDSLWNISRGGWINAAMIYNSVDCAVRPVITLTSSTNVTVQGNLWTVVK